MKLFVTFAVLLGSVPFSTAGGIDECASNPCMNGGTCIKVEGYYKPYRCTCARGWTGETCSDDLDECLAGWLCENGGTCVNLIGSYTCRCTNGMTGATCGEYIDECTSEPCQNGATCINNQGSFRCVCPSAWTGDTCTNGIDECLIAQPCQNEGTCVNLPGSYRCTCARGWTGNTCSQDIDECTSEPCQNGGQCFNQPGGYFCVCVDGWTGDTCNHGECASGPCWHGATCVNQPGAYNCTCPSGWEGETCRVDVDECASNPCQNGGTCFNGPGSYSCYCTRGWAGETCTDVGEPPMFSRATDHKIQYFTTDSQLEIQCAATGVPEPQFSWTKDGEPFNHLIGRYIFDTRGIPTLQIQSAQEQDAGMYKCYATNEYGTAVSASIEVVRAYIHFHAGVGTDPKEISVNAGESLTLRCDRPESVPQSRIQWRLKSLDKSVKERELLFSNRVIMDQQGNLQFSYVDYTDEQEGYTYYCGVYNEVLRVETGYPGYTIKVKRQDVISRQAEIITASRDVKVLRGDMMTLECVFSWFPEPLITWAKVNGTLPTTNRVRKPIYDQTQHLIFTNVQFTDEGAYTCTAHTGPNEPVVETIEVVVEAAPYRTGMSAQLGMESHVRAPTESVTFDCSAEGVPTPAYTWYINGILIQQSHMSASGFESDVADEIAERTYVVDGQLTINNLQIDDDLVVQCNASNVHGYLWNNAHLRMKYDPNATTTETPPSAGTRASTAIFVIMLPILLVLFSMVKPNCLISI